MLTKDLLRALRPEIEAAISTIGAKHGVELSLGNCSFTPTNGTFKLAVNSIDKESGTAVTKELADLRRMLPMLGLTESHLNQVFKIGSKSFTLAGYRSASRTKPFLMTALDNGKRYIATEEQVRRGLGLPLTAVETRVPPFVA